MLEPAGDPPAVACGCAVCEGGDGDADEDEDEDADECEEYDAVVGGAISASSCPCPPDAPPAAGGSPKVPTPR